ncbi:GntR family transcriptional regulator [bacterium]|nr:GntR family transcriptional regulator [bacterium]MBD3238935.1 GntR family transcriptional regulator [Chitinivibrionales bacterium]
MKPARNRARRFLEGQVARAVASAATQLPSIKQLAAQAGVAQATMWAAVQQLKYEGIVSARPRKGVRVECSAMPPARRETAAAGPKWLRAQGKLRRDIASGVYEAGDRLPSCKELMARHEISYPTLRKVLDGLEREGTIRACTRGYMVPDVRRRRGLDTVFLIAATTDDGELVVTIPRTPEYLRTLEYEVLKKNLNFVMIPWSNSRLQLDIPEEWAGAFRASPQTHPLLGILVWMTGIAEDQSAALLRRLAALKRPVSVLDDSGQCRPLARQLRSSRQIRFFGVGATESVATREIGRFLIQSGHRRVAWISPLNAAHWSRDRQRGLQEVFREAGLDDGVVSFTIENAGSEIELIDNDQEVLSWILAGLDHARGECEGLSNLAGETVGHLRRKVDMSFKAILLRRYLEPLCEQALADPAISAWVVANDPAALLALSFLEKRGVKVPQQISVIGFDDSVEAFMRKLSSYNFAGPAVMQAMLHNILDPASFERLHGRGNHIEIEGFFNLRQTTR